MASSRDDDVQWLSTRRAPRAAEHLSGVIRRRRYGTSNERAREHRGEEQERRPFLRVEPGTKCPVSLWIARPKSSVSMPSCEPCELRKERPATFSGSSVSTPMVTNEVFLAGVGGVEAVVDAAALVEPAACRGRGSEEQREQHGGQQVRRRRASPLRGRAVLPPMRSFGGHGETVLDRRATTRRAPRTMRARALRSPVPISAAPRRDLGRVHVADTTRQRFPDRRSSGSSEEVVHPIARTLSGVPVMSLRTGCAT